MKDNKNNFGAMMYSIDLKPYFNWPKRLVKGKFQKSLKEKIINAPKGPQRFWGIPFKLGESSSKRVVLANKDNSPKPIIIGKKADYLCFLHQWEQMNKEINAIDPQEGLVVGEYVLEYSDGNSHTQMIRARFEIGISFSESPGPAWLAVPYKMYKAFDPAAPPDKSYWGKMQMGSEEIIGEYLV